VGRAAEKAAKRAAATVLLSKLADADKYQEAEKGGVKFSKGAHAESTIGRLRNCRSRLSRRTLLQGCLQ
jgi:hypothetical protein